MCALCCLKKYTVGCFRPASVWGAGYLPWRRPECITGAGSLQRLPELLADTGCKKPMIMVSRRQCAAPEFIATAEKLPAWSGFHGVTANPKIETVEQIVAQFRVEKARAFIDAIYRMNRALGIPERFPCIRPEDLPQMAAWAEAEANPCTRCR